MNNCLLILTGILCGIICGIGGMALNATFDTKGLGVGVALLTYAVSGSLLTIADAIKDNKS
ncbi:MAG: hypothetical protein ABH822_02710 [Patescibacteria group bacterium]